MKKYGKIPQNFSSTRRYSYLSWCSAIENRLPRENLVIPSSPALAFSVDKVRTTSITSHLDSFFIWNSQFKRELEKQHTNVFCFNKRLQQKNMFYPKLFVNCNCICGFGLKLFVQGWDKHWSEYAISTSFYLFSNWMNWFQFYKKKNFTSSSGTPNFRRRFLALLKDSFRKSASVPVTIRFGCASCSSLLC